MSQDKKFIITNNKTTAAHLIAKGVKLISNINNTWTFENKLPKDFSFSEVDKNEIAYTNILSL